MVLSSLWEDSAVGGQVSGWIKTLWISVSAGHGPDKISRIGRYWTTLVSLSDEPHIENDNASCILHSTHASEDTIRRTFGNIVPLINVTCRSHVWDTFYIGPKHIVKRKKIYLAETRYAI